MPKPSVLRAPFLKRVSLVPEKVRRDAFPFDSLRFLRDDDFALDFESPITVFVGENGSGKSTLLEGIAAASGFHAQGGSQDHQVYAPRADEHALGRALRCAWLPKVSNGFFFRAESFFGLARYIDEAGRAERSGGRLLHRQSHGEAFLATFHHRFDARRPALYLLDEPEAALSPARQLEFLRLMRAWEAAGTVQAIVVTHAPILMAYPGATLLDFTRQRIRRVAFDDVEHTRTLRDFFADPHRFVAAALAAE